MKLTLCRELHTYWRALFWLKTLIRKGYVMLFSLLLCGFSMRMKNTVNYIFLGKTQWRLKEKKAITIHRVLFGLQTHHLRLQTAKHTKAYICTSCWYKQWLCTWHTNILVPHHTIHTTWKHFPGLVCLLEVVGVTWSWKSRAAGSLILLRDWLFWFDFLCETLLGMLCGCILVTSQIL